jgi:probable rRNA maturation factor
MNLVNYKEIGKGVYKKIAEATLKYIKYPLNTAEITLVLCDNNFIKELNSKYRGIDGPTDVISFPMNDSTIIQEPLLGDIVIAIDIAKENCLETQLTLCKEVTYLFVHGLLHLLGFNHESSKIIEEEMYDIQDKMMMQLDNFMH